MALVACKECRKFVYEYAETCPQCGVNCPGKTHEEEQLEAAIERSAKQEKEYERMYTEYHHKSFIEKLFQPGMVDKYVELAREAQRERLKLLDQLHKVRETKDRRSAR